MSKTSSRSIRISFDPMTLVTTTWCVACQLFDAVVIVADQGTKTRCFPCKSCSCLYGAGGAGELPAN